jgi:hypothetical protein
MAKKKSAAGGTPRKKSAPRNKSVLPPQESASRGVNPPGPNTKKRQIEQYDHAGAKRANNPPVGLVTPETDPPNPARKTYQYDPHLDPQLVWAGKAEHTSFEVPTVSLHVHERIDPRTIIKAVRSNGHYLGDKPQGSQSESSQSEPRGLSPRSSQRQQGLFDSPEETLPRRRAARATP